MATCLFDNYEWDSNKNKANRLKHGIEFEDAIQVFNHPNLQIRSDRNEEVHYVTLGKARGCVVAVIHTERQGRTRIISARLARIKEREVFETRIGGTSKE